MIDHLPDPPQPGDTIPDFQRKAAAHVLAQRLWTDQANATADLVNDQTAAVAANVLLVDADALAAVGAKNEANSARNQAVLSAGTATTKAGEASGSAELAATKRQESVDAAIAANQSKLDTQQLKADTVLLKEGAQESAAAAAASATKAGAPLVATSTTSIPVQAGPVVLDVGLGKGFAPGQYVAIARTAAPSTALRGLVTSYANAGAGPLAVTVDKTDGTGGTYASWTVSLAGRDAVAGARERVLVDAATVTLEHGKDYVLIFAGAVTATMPAAPTWGGASIGLMVANGRTDNAVAWNGAKHQGIADAQMSIDDPFASFQLVPLNATYGWGIA